MQNDGNGINKNLREFFEFRLDALDQLVKEYGDNFKDFVKEKFDPFHEEMMKEMTRINTEGKIKANNSAIKISILIGIGFTLLNFVLTKL